MDFEIISFQKTSVHTQNVKRQNILVEHVNEAPSYFIFIIIRLKATQKF